MTEQEQESRETRLQHIVLMRFPRDLTAAEDAELRTIVAGCRVVDELLVCRFDTDLSGGTRSRGYQYLLYTEVRDEAALAAYGTHPAHRVLGRWLDDHGCERLAFDYLITAPTVSSG